MICARGREFTEVVEEGVERGWEEVPFTRELDAASGISAGQ